jgi:hypothetical protein
MFHAKSAAATAAMASSTGRAQAGWPAGDRQNSQRFRPRELRAPEFPESGLAAR